MTIFKKKNTAVAILAIPKLLKKLKKWLKIRRGKGKERSLQYYRAVFPHQR